ncbi:ABC transporter permease [Clostridium niameyense]|uniref:ABC transporter permease n=1 Tax=Clostridium niameyense TaxID=1622073 RepID=A0A6M0RA79_9CLOT|nr:ABC transporter permease [Clostridium niameyense]NEZ47132.1 ABC transporter permease [Clostridium niameyense]
MLNLLKAECYKLKKSKMLYFFIALTILQLGVIYIFSPNLKSKQGEEALSYIFLMQGSLGNNILVGIFAVDFIVTEFTSGYIKNLISYGHKRKDIFLSKSIAYYIGVLAIQFSSILIMILLDILINGNSKFIYFNSLASLVVKLLIILLIYISLASIIVLAAFLSKNYITIGIVIALDFLNRVLNVINVQKPYLNYIFNKLIFFQINVVSIDKVTYNQYFQAIIIALVTLIINTLLTNYIFNKSDIK